MAVHTGEAQLRDEGNYFGHDGHPLRSAARDRGHGGQILVSDATAALVARPAPRAGMRCSTSACIGSRTSAAPEHVWQLVHPDLPPTFPPLRSLDAYRHNLPIQLTPLIGRRRDVDVLAACSARERLVTLTGSGGVGKTRLALARGRGGARAVSRRGVVGGAGAASADPGRSGAAALAALGAREAPGGWPGRPARRRRSATSRRSRCLDNCEHLVAVCAELVAGLLARSCSRDGAGDESRAARRAGRDHVAGAVAVDCPTPEIVMAVPRARRSTTPSVCSSIVPRRARPTFVVSDANAPRSRRSATASTASRSPSSWRPPVAGRCPLERIASSSTIASGSPRGRARTVIARQQTLAASVEWSHDRLDESRADRVPPPRRVRRGVPAGGGRGRGVGVGRVEPVTVFDVVSRLSTRASWSRKSDRAANSTVPAVGDTPRPSRWTRPAPTGELDAVRDAHLTFWVDWLEAQAPTLHTDAVIDHVELFHDCLTAALDWSTRDNRGRAAPAAPARPPVARHRSAARRARRGRRAAHRRERRALPDALGRSRAVSGRPRRDFTRRARLGRVDRARGTSWPKRAARSTGSRSANGFSATQKTTAGAYGSSPTSATSATSRPGHHPPGPSCRRDSERRVDACSTSPDLRAAAAREPLICATPPTERPAEPRSPWAISAGASRSPADSARPRRC